MNMAFFDFFSLLLAGAFLVLGCRPQCVQDGARLRNAVTLFLWSVVLFYPIPALFGIGVYLGFVTQPVGMVLSLLSFRQLWLSLTSPAVGTESSGSAVT